MQEYDLYFAHYDTDRSRVEKYYHQQIKEQSHRVEKIKSLHESIKQAEDNRQEKLKSVQMKAHKFNARMQRVKRANHMAQERTFSRILEQKRSIHEKEQAVEKRLDHLNAKQIAYIEQHKQQQLLKQQLYFDRVQQHKHELNQVHEELLTYVEDRFKLVDDYIQSKRDEVKLKYRSLSTRYLQNKQKAEQLIEDHEKSTLQITFAKMVQREQQFLKYKDANEANRKKIVRRNKLERLKFTQSKQKLENPEKYKLMHPQSVSPSAEIATSLKHIRRDRLLSKKDTDSVFERSPRASILKEDHEVHLQRLMKLRMSLKRVKDTCEDQFHSFFLSQQPYLTS